jgi:hypothetical protein
MAKIKISSLFLLLILLGACGQDYGNKLESNELDIFFTNPDDEEIARNIAMYWKEHQLLGEKKQFLQIERKGQILELKLIPSAKFEPKQFSFDERAILKSLQDSLQKVVHPNRLELVIANRQFKTLYNINQ